MKISVLFSIGMLIQCYVFTQGISRGPEPGEIYFIGPTTLTLYDGIYRSTDYGNTAILMSDHPQPAGDLIGGLVADRTFGSVYFVTSLSGNLYYSSDFGQSGSWILKQTNLYPYLLSGVIEGQVFQHIEKYSMNYGTNFMTNSNNGFFGYLLDPAIDNAENTGYALVKKAGVDDTTFLLISYDNFENLQIQNVLYSPHFPMQRISRGGQSGEIISVMGGGYWPVRVMYTTDYGITWQENQEKETYIHNPSYFKFCGGVEPGELYISVLYLQFSGEIRHTYIYHSTDYGETFEIFHPFSYGPDPYFINFEAEPRTGPFPLTVQFTNTSSGAWENWAWDFNGDSIWDSFEMNPTYTYQDTGKFNVILKGIPDDWPPPDSLQKRNFIHVTDTTTSIFTILYSEIKLYPLPCKSELMIQFSGDYSDAIVSIFRLDGRLMKCTFEKFVQSNPQQLRIDLKDIDDGIYILNIETPNSFINKKFIKRS